MISKAKHDEIIRVHATGKPYREVAAIVGVGSSTVARVIKQRENVRDAKFIPVKRSTLLLLTKEAARRDLYVEELAGHLLNRAAAQLEIIG